MIRTLLNTVFIFLLVSTNLLAQNSCSNTVNWSGGWCDICGGPTGNYACSPPNCSPCGTWDNGCKSIFNCVPLGNVITGVAVTIKWINIWSIPSYISVELNGVLIDSIFSNPGGGGCGGCIVSSVYKSFTSLPGYNYGGSNTLCLVPDSQETACVSQAVITLTYDDSTLITYPGSIVGIQAPCDSTVLTYSTASVSTAAWYSWTVPSDWSIQSGQGDTLITVLSGSGADSLCVEACDSTGCSILSCIWVQPTNIGVELGNDTSYCEGGVLLLEAQNSGGSFIWQDSSTSQNYAVTVSGQYTVEVTDLSGCITSDTVNVTVNPVYAFDDTVAICEGDSIYLEGVFQMNAGLYNDAFNAVGGCDSLYFTTLIIKPTTILLDTLNICDGDSVFLAGEFQTSAGIYSDSLTKVNGCDSVKHTSLVVYNSNIFNPTSTICYGDSVYLEGAFQFNSGVYLDVYNSVDGCDSVVQMNLTVDSVEMPIIVVAGLVLTSSQAVSYQWYFNGTLILGATEQAVAIMSDGYYKVLVADSNGCSASSDYVLITALSIADIDVNNRLSVYPNPTSGMLEFYINLLTDKNYEIKLYDLTGRVVYSSNIIASGNGVSGTIDLTPYSKGVYYLEVFNSAEFYTVKIIYKN